MESGVYQNNKTGKYYNVMVDDTVINSTNAADGQLMVEYIDPKTKQRFVREISEFEEKFTKVK